MGGVVATEREGNLGRALRTVFEGGAAAGLTDAQLVDRVANGGEAARTALAALVARHGPMVLRACRAGARDEHDADDAFQAVFLVLARKAGSIRVPETLTPWLHGVALRTTAAARVASARRHALDRRRAEAQRPSATGGACVPDDLAPLIHEELGKLPDRYRSALVLCDLEGLSHEEAARRLGWPVGTVKSRQARGRERLRGRLIRRGVAPAIGLGFLATAASAKTGVPEGLAAETVDAAIVYLKGSGAAGAVSAAPATLARKALNAMILSRLKTPTIALLAAGILAAGASTTLRGGAHDPEAAQATAPAPAADRPAGKPLAPGSLLQFHFVADSSRDADAIERALKSDLDKPPEGYRWFLLSRFFAGNDRGGMTIRKAPTDGAEWVLLKLDPQNVTEHDFARVARTRDERDQSAVSVRFTADGARRFGELTRSRLPEDGGVTRHKLAILFDREVLQTPYIFSEVRDAAIISFGTRPPAEEFDRLFDRLSRFVEANAKPTSQPARSQDEALRLARESDIPALARADRVTIERSGNQSGFISAVPKTVASFRDALKPRDVHPSAGERAATVIFSRGDEPIREVWVYEGGEWGFVRPGTSWTTGQSDELWGLLKPTPRE